MVVDLMQLPDESGKPVDLFIPFVRMLFYKCLQFNAFQLFHHDPVSFAVHHDFICIHRRDPFFMCQLCQHIFLPDRLKRNGWVKQLHDLSVSHIIHSSSPAFSDHRPACNRYFVFYLTVFPFLLTPHVFSPLYENDILNESDYLSARGKSLSFHHQHVDPFDFSVHTVLCEPGVYSLEFVAVLILLYDQSVKGLLGIVLHIPALFITAGFDPGFY